MDVCIICMRKVLDIEEGLQCENVCARWFHCDCMNITKSYYNNLARVLVRSGIVPVLIVLLPNRTQWLSLNLV